MTQLVQTGAWASRAGQYIGLTSSNSKIAEADSRRRAIFISVNVSNVPSVVTLFVGGRQAPTSQIEFRMVAGDFVRQLCMRKWEIGGIICGEIWGASTAGATEVFLVEVLKVGL